MRIQCQISPIPVARAQVAREHQQQLARSPSSEPDPSHNTHAAFIDRQVKLAKRATEMGEL